MGKCGRLLVELTVGKFAIWPIVDSSVVWVLATLLTEEREDGVGFDGAHHAPSDNGKDIQL